MSMQFSRGCPFRCEFCDIIVMFGRRPRVKSHGQIGAELDELRKLNVRHVFFVDDNLIGNIKAAKELLRFLSEYQKVHDYRFHFATEASLNLSQDRELLDLFRDANFQWVFIGIESPDENSLKETKKLQNTRSDILESVREIYRHGLDVTAGFIIGFDNDTTDVFDKQYRFIVDSGIQLAMIGLLQALERTPLYKRLEKENRLIPDMTGTDNSKLATNIVPKRMTYDQLIAGYRALHHRLLQNSVIAERIRNKVRYLSNPPYENERSTREGFALVGKVVRQIVKQEGILGLLPFLRSLPLSRPRLIPQVIRDWVFGLSTRDYVDRHFERESEHDRRLARSHLTSIKTALSRYLHGGSLKVSLSQSRDATSHLSFHINGRLDRAFFGRAAHHLDKMLRNTRSSLTLRIENFDARELHMLQSMLDQLLTYRDRIKIAADEQSRRIIKIDSSVFNLVVAPVISSS
jgi:hypothetical protein